MRTDKMIFLTFDMDWVNDRVLEWFYLFIEKYGLSATIFVTHKTKWLQTFQENKKIELGIHPNFNKLLAGTTELNEGDYTDIIKSMKQLVPDAVSYRSHTLAVSTLLIKECAENGIKYDLNMYVPPYDGLRLHPFKRSGITMVPFIYEDDLWLLEKEKLPVEYYLSDRFDMKKVFNFHPIHLYLNCEKCKRYENAKKYGKEPKRLCRYRNPLKNANGICNFLIDLILYAQKSGYSFGLIQNI